MLWQLLVGMILVTAGLTCVLWLLQSLRLIDMIVNRGLTTGLFMYLTMLLLPNFLSIILPIALFAVVLFTYSKLIADRELVVMRAAGVSQSALAQPAIVLGLLVVMIAYGVNIFLVPQSYRQFRELQWNFRYSYARVFLREGAFNSIAKGVTVYVRERSKDGQLHGILVYLNRDGEKPHTFMAERGAMVETEDTTRVVMFNGNRHEVDEQTKQMSILYFDRSTLDFDVAKNRDPDRYREARERTLDELFHLERDPRLSKKDYGKFTVEAHKRLVSPLSALGFTLVGMACLISGSFSRRAQTRRVVLAVIIVVLLILASLGLDNASARRLELIPLMYVNAIIPIIGGFVFMLRSPRRRRNAGDDGALATS